MLAAILSHDRPGGAEIRARHRAAHMDYLAASAEVVLAGPFLDEAGNVTGSLVVVDVPDLAAARAWAAADPFAAAGLFAGQTVQGWRKVVG